MSPQHHRLLLLLYILPLWTPDIHVLCKYGNNNNLCVMVAIANVITSQPHHRRLQIRMC